MIPKNSSRVRVCVARRWPRLRREITWIKYAKMFGENDHFHNENTWIKYAKTVPRNDDHFDNKTL